MHRSMKRFGNKKSFTKRKVLHVRKWEKREKVFLKIFDIFAEIYLGGNRIC